jgi:hypothetical protein
LRFNVRRRNGFALAANQASRMHAMQSRRLAGFGNLGVSISQSVEEVIGPALDLDEAGDAFNEIGGATRQYRLSFTSRLFNRE